METLFEKERKSLHLLYMLQEFWEKYVLLYLLFNLLYLLCMFITFLFFLTPHLTAYCILFLHFQKTAFKVLRCPYVSLLLFNLLIQLEHATYMCSLSRKDTHTAMIHIQAHTHNLSPLLLLSVSMLHSLATAFQTFAFIYSVFSYSSNLLPSF